MASCQPCRGVPPELRVNYQGKIGGSHVHRVARRADYAVQERVGRREGIREVRGLADCRGHRRARPVRHDRQIAHALHGRAQAGHRYLHPDRQGHRRSGDRRHRLELDRGGDRAHPARQAGGRRRRHAGRALLQQADAGRPVPAFQGGGRGCRHPDPALQRAAANRRRHAGRDRRAPVAGPEASSASRTPATTWRGRR